MQLRSPSHWQPAQRPTEVALFATYGKQFDRASALFGHVSMQYSTSDGKAAFGWLGGPKRLCNPTEIEGSSSYSASLPHVLIPNDVPEGARECIDNNPPA